MAINSSNNEVIQRTLDAVFKIISDQGLQEKLQNDQQRKIVLDSFNLPEAAGQRLFLIIKRVEQLTRAKAIPEPDEEPSMPQYNIGRILLETYVYIRWSFWLSLTISILLFMVGLAFWGITLTHAAAESAVSTATLTMAGVGVADFVLLFYTRPWQDIATNLGNAQRIRIIATSYLAGLSLLHDGKTEQLSLLEQFTQRSIDMLNMRADPDSPATVDKP